MSAYTDRFLYFLVHFKGLLRGFSKRYFSQWGEDIVLKGIFKTQKKGVYVDVGAYHPFHYSNTHLLYRRGWSGINIDPNPHAISLFRFHRPRDINLNYGVSENDHKATYYQFNHQACNTFSTIQRDLMLKRPFIRLIGERQVPCAPLQKLLDTYAVGKEVDFLNIDVEGMSMEVLRSIEWSRVRPRAICIEDDEFVWKQGSEIDSYLTAREYVLHSRVGRSSIYVHA